MLGQREKQQDGERWKTREVKDGGRGRAEVDVGESYDLEDVERSFCRQLGQEATAAAGREVVRYHTHTHTESQ